MTEDNNPDGFYRFIPKVPGKLAKGGRVQMLGIKGEPGYGTVTGQRVGDKLPVIWIDIDDPEPSNIEDDATCRLSPGPEQGRRQVPVRRRLHVSQRFGRVRLVGRR